MNPRQVVQEIGHQYHKIKAQTYRSDEGETEQRKETHKDSTTWTQNMGESYSILICI